MLARSPRWSPAFPELTTGYTAGPLPGFAPASPRGLRLNSCQQIQLYGLLDQLRRRRDRARLLRRPLARSVLPPVTFSIARSASVRWSARVRGPRPDRRSLHRVPAHPGGVRRRRADGGELVAAGLCPGMALCRCSRPTASFPPTRSHQSRWFWKTAAALLRPSAGLPPPPGSATTLISTPASKNDQGKAIQCPVSSWVSQLSPPACCPCFCLSRPCPRARRFAPWPARKSLTTAPS